MAVDPKKLIGAIVPDVYCKDRRLKPGEADEFGGGVSTLRQLVKKIVKDSITNKEPDAYVKAAAKVELVDPDFMDFDAVIKTPFALMGIKNPFEQHTIDYDTSGQALEQVYYWLHDYIINTKSDYGTAEKITDNFISAPGSAHFSEMGMKAAKMQEEGMKILGVANQLIKTILNIIYDLKEFKLRLAIYDEYNQDKDKSQKEAAYLSLKQVWLDQVDIKRGNSSIKALAVSGANQPNFVLLIDAFMAVRSQEEIDKMDLNERVKRLLKQRFGEFENWLRESQKEIRKRYEIEKIYLKSQVNNVKLYSKWAKPYLKAAARLEQRATETSALVTTFNTSLFELTLMGNGEYNPEIDFKRGELPKVFRYANTRKYSQVVLVELKFRSIPERFQQGGYGFRGKATITFTSFCLNAEERKKLMEQLEWDDFRDVYNLIGGATEESLGQLQTDINELLGENEFRKKAEKSSSEETNPFSALLSAITDLFNKPAEVKKEEKKEKKLEITPDTEMEKVMRSQAGIEARMRCRKFYDTFKKMNNSPAF